MREKVFKLVKERFLTKTGIGEPVAIVNHCNLVRVNLNYAFYYVEVDKTGPKKNGCKMFTGYQFISPFYVHLPRTYVV